MKQSTKERLAEAWVLGFLFVLFTGLIGLCVWGLGWLFLNEPGEFWALLGIGAFFGVTAWALLNLPTSRR